MYWGKQRFIQVLVFGKFWCCSLIKGLEYLRLKVLLINFYPIWKCKKKLAWHRIFLAIYLSLRRNQCFCEKKNQIFDELQVKKTSSNALDILGGHPHLYVTFSVSPSVRLSVCQSVCPSVRLFVCLSVAHHISGTVHHMIIIFDIHV